MGYIAETAVKVTADTKGFHAQAQTGIMSSMTRIASGAAAALGGLAIGKALFVDPIKSAGDFQQTLNVLQATAKSGGATLQDVQAKAMALGADLRLPATSANDAATAMLEMGKGGFTMKQSMEAAHGVLLLSAAAQIDNATAAQYTADSLHAFGLRAKDSMTVVDDFAGAANASTASMDQVGQALQQSGAAFHNLGIPIGDAATAIAVMANNGIKGSDAGTSLKTMLQRLNPQTTAAKKAMQEMGVQTFDSNGKFVGLRGVIEQMGPKLADMTQKQRSQALATIFGSDASRAAGFILGQTTTQWDKQHDAVTKAGQAQALANAQSKGFNGAMAGLRSTIETLQLQIGLKMLPVLTEFVRFLAENLPAAVATVSGAFATLGGIIQSIANFLTENVGSWRQLGIALAAGVTAVIALSVAMGVLNAVMAVNPITLVIIAIAALVIGLTLLYQRSQTAAAIMNAAWAGLRAAATATFGFITNTVIPQAIAAWQRFGPGVVSALNSAVSAIRTVVQAIATVVSTIVDQIRQHWEAVWKVFGPLVVGYLQVVRTVVQTTLNVIAGVVRLFAALLRGDWSAAWNALKGIVSDILSGIVSIVGSILRGLAGTAKGLAVAVGTAIANGIKTAAVKLAGLAGDLAGRVSGALSQVAGQALGWAQGIGSAIVSGILSGVTSLPGQLKSKLESMIGGVLGSINIPGKSPPEHAASETIGVPIARGIINGAVDGLNEMGGKMGTKLAQVADQVATMTKANASKVAGAVKNWAEQAKSAFDAEAGKLKDILGKQLDAAKAKIDKWKASLTPAEVQLKTQAAERAMATLVGTLNNAWTALKALPQQQANAMTALISQQKTAWDTLIANQAAAMATLQANQTQNATSDLIAGHELNKTQAATANDPLAGALLQTHASLDTIKALYNQGAATQAQLLAAQDAFDAASLAAQDDTDAQKLDRDYVTWQTAHQQAIDGAAAIASQQITDNATQTAQLASDLDARIGLQGTFNQQTLDATTTKDNALQALLDANLEAVANKERADRDRAAGELNTALVARYNRIDTHLDNVRKNTDAHYDELARMATASGNNIGENLSNALRNTIPSVAAAAAAVAQAISNSLKVRSPTKEGPMSDLHHWWDRLAPTLLQGFDGSRVQAALHAAVMPPSAAGGRAGQIRQSGIGETWSSARMEMLLERIEKHTQATAAKPDPKAEVHIAGSIGIDASTYRARR